ncbi:MAG: type II 3-dehydroquinate dehydratase [Candidatus Aceula meridiana]|nr:type II 3-dehydroquinate dehydratase [Candidatus Aceula meridiana]
MQKILVIHGPNLDLLGARETDIYGKVSLDKINKQLQSSAKEGNVSLQIIQTNHEGEIVDAIGSAPKNGVVAILINPAAYTHTSVAIRDAIAAVSLPTVEVHLSNIYAREEFRQTSLISPVSTGQVSGFGPQSYILGLKAILGLIKK